MFDTPTTSQPIGNSIGWLTNLLLGEVAVTLCIIAIALVGFSMLTGRLPLRRGAQVILGCVLLLAAPAIAAAMMAWASPAGTARSNPAPAVVYEAQPRPPLPQTDTDTTRASMRRRPPD